MKINKKLLQITLIFIGLFLIVATYFYYPTINTNKLSKSVIQNDKSLTVEKDKNRDKEDNSFEDVEYKGLYDLDKPFIILSEKAFILSEKPEIVNMANIKISIEMKDGRTVVITGDKGKYNKNTYDCYVESNVKATDGEMVISSENLDLLATKDIISIYNEVKLISKNGSLKADKVYYDFESKNYKISMYDKEKVKIKFTE